MDTQDIAILRVVDGLWETYEWVPVGEIERRVSSKIDLTKKLKGLEKLLDESGVELENIAYVGDDVLDIPVARRVGFSAAVANAVDELKSHVSYVTSRKGGCGAIREVVEYILKNTGRWDALMERYLV